MQNVFLEMWPLLDPHRQDCSCTTDVSVVKMFKIQYSTHQHLTVTCDEDDSVGVNLKANYGGIFLVSIFPSVAETPLDTSTTFQNPAGRHPLFSCPIAIVTRTCVNISTQVAFSRGKWPRDVGMWYPDHGGDLVKAEFACVAAPSSTCHQAR